MYTMQCKPTDMREVVKERAVVLAFLLHHPVYVVCGDASIPGPIYIAEPCELGVRVELGREYEEWVEACECDPQFICAPLGYISATIVPSDPQPPLECAA